MNKVLSMIFVVLASSVAMADYSSVRCDFKGEGLLEAVLGKFEKIQTECCKKRIEAKVFCESHEEYQKCNNGGKGTFYAVNSGVECSEGCKLFREDCDDFISDIEVRRGFQ
ncbi:MAG: hypothetical protein V4654_08485 [Bdellovibrionota bacterium]